MICFGQKSIGWRIKPVVHRRAIKPDDQHVLAVLDYNSGGRRADSGLQRIAYSLRMRCIHAKRGGGEMPIPEGKRGVEFPNSELQNSRLAPFNKLGEKFRPGWDARTEFHIHANTSAMGHRPMKLILGKGFPATMRRQLAAEPSVRPPCRRAA
jgi:hypothetical protein